MMIYPEYCLRMARYNTWQNAQLATAFGSLSDAALTMDRKAFFGSILATANHILWADRIWMFRLGAGDAPDGDHLSFTASGTEWIAARKETDAALLNWAASLTPDDLSGEVVWHSVMMGQDFTHPFDLCVTHLFNHQTHHRGQIHAMLTAAGAKAPVTDGVFMPETDPWL